MQQTSVSCLWVIFMEKLSSVVVIQSSPQRKLVFLQVLIRISTVSGWWEWNQKVPFNSCPIKSRSIHHSSFSRVHIFHWCERGGSGGFLEICFPRGSPQWQSSASLLASLVYRSTGSECFLWGYMECQKNSANPNLKSTHTRTTWGGIQEASAEQNFSRRGVRERLIFGGNATPHSAGKECTLSPAELRECLALT